VGYAHTTTQGVSAHFYPSESITAFRFAICDRLPAAWVCNGESALPLRRALMAFGDNNVLLFYDRGGNAGDRLGRRGR